MKEVIPEKKRLSVKAAHGAGGSTDLEQPTSEEAAAASVAPMACCDCTHQAKIWTHAEFRSCQPWGAFEV